MESKALYSLKSSPYLRECCYCAIDCATVTRGGEAGFETLKCNAEIGTRGVKLVSVNRLQQLDVMPPKAKKRKIQAGQLTLSFGHPTDQGAALQLSPPLTLRRNRRATRTQSRLLLLRTSHRRGEETSHRGGALPRVNGPRSIRG